MAGLFQEAKPRELWKLAWPFLLSGTAGGGLMWFSRAYSGHEFLLALSDALVIAGVVGLSLELIAASMLIDHAAKELSSRLVGYGLPKQAQAIINKLVHETKFVYREYKRTYRIVPNPVRETHVRIESVVSYLVVNYGRAAEEYKGPVLEESEMYFPIVDSLQYGTKVIKGENLEAELHARGLTFRITDKIIIAPSECDTPLDMLRPDQKCFVRWSYSMQMPNHYSDVTAFVGVTIHPQIELLGKPDDFEFLASEDNNCRHVGSLWTYEQAFIAGQHVRAWWQKKEDEPSVV